MVVIAPAALPLVVFPTATRMAKWATSSIAIDTRDPPISVEPSIRLTVPSESRVAMADSETRVRPKDRKTPHLAQRHKYAKGLAKVRSHTKSFKPEPEAGFSGTIRPGIKHSTRL